MARPKIDYGETDTAVPTLERTASKGGSALIAIAFHPETDRIGEELMVGSGPTWLQRLSRLEGEFINQASGESAPLGTSQVSRDPIEVRREGGQLVFAQSGRSPLLVDGCPVEGRLTIDAARLRPGVVIELGRSVVLFLHESDGSRAGPSDELGMVGSSAELELVRQQVRRVADLRVPVLVRGETGTGKELVARALHRLSGRRGTFVAVNLGAVSESTAAAELFGHVKGAFTDAKADGKGYFQTADGGTLFLDEIGEASIDTQVKLLRALETGDVLRVGSSLPIKLDVRVVAATDAALEQAMAHGRFKAPLFHRLAQFCITLPPLRVRLSDVPRLFITFLKTALDETRQQRSLGGWFPAALMARLLRHNWPGNVRELKSFATSLAITNRGRDEFLLPPDLDARLASPPAAVRRSVESPQMDRAEVDVVPNTMDRIADIAPEVRSGGPISDAAALAVLQAHLWEVRPAARALGIAPNTLYQIIDRSPNLMRAADVEAEAILGALEQHGGDQALAANHLRLSLRALRQRMRELGIAGSS